MRIAVWSRLLVAAVAVNALSSCSDDCPNCPGAVATVQVSPGVSSVLPGSQLQLAAVVQDAAGHLLSGHDVTWNSSDATVATVDQDGLVSGVAVGPVTITAQVAGKSGTGTVNVVTTSTLSAQVQPIFTTSCATAFCHVSPGPPPNLTSAATAFAALTAVGAGYLTAGDTSLGSGKLLDRLRNSNNPMPPGGAFATLQPGNYDLIALWIAQGAANN